MLGAVVEGLEAADVGFTAGDHLRDGDLGVHQDFVPGFGRDAHLLVGSGKPAQEVALGTTGGEEMRLQGVEEIDVVAGFDLNIAPAKKPRVEHLYVEAFAEICDPTVEGFEGFFGGSDDLSIVAWADYGEGAGAAMEGEDGDNQDGVVVAPETGCLDINKPNGSCMFDQAQKHLRVYVQR